MQTVFSVENLKQFSSDYFCRLFIATSTLCSQIDKLKDEMEICQSSTYNIYWTPDGKDREVEFILRRNYVTPKTSLCSAPFSWANYLESTAPSLKRNACLSKKLGIAESIQPFTPWLHKSRVIPWGQVVHAPCLDRSELSNSAVD